MLADFVMHDMSWGWGALMVLGWLAIWALLLGGALSLWRDRRGPTARELLDRRLAAGDITVEEYERLRRAMSGPRTSPPAAE